MSPLRFLPARVPLPLILGPPTARTSPTIVRCIRTLSVRAPYGPVGVARALQGSTATSAASTRISGPTLFTNEFSLTDRVALVTGANRGIGLEAALALVEAGARRVYCVDVHAQPGEEWGKVCDLAARMGLGKLEYVRGDVRDQDAMWQLGETIGNREGRMDVCVAAAGIYEPMLPCLDYPAKEYQDVIDVNLKGCLFTAQACGRQMVRFNNGGSIVLIGSICGNVALEPTLCTVPYHTTKAGVLQMARSMACELGSKGIRVNTISPGFITTRMTAFLDDPELMTKYSGANPLGRIGRPDELRGVVTWLASDSSSFCTGSDIIVSGGHHAW